MNRQLVFTAYNRPEYLNRTIASWNSVRGLNTWPTSFFVEPSDQQGVVADLALALDTTVTIHQNQELQGVLVNPWNAFNTAFEGGADFVVLAEDDVEVSQDILEMFEWTSIEYQTSYNVLCINAFSDLGGTKSNQLIAEAKFSPLIWGTWRDRWDNILRDTWDKDYSSGLSDGSQAGWDWNINRIIAANQYRVIKPLQSRSNHIGLFGTHMTPDLMQTSQGTDFTQIRGRQRYIEI